MNTPKFYNIYRKYASARAFQLHKPIKDWKDGPVLDIQCDYTMVRALSVAGEKLNIPSGLLGAVELKG